MREANNAEPQRRQAPSPAAIGSGSGSGAGGSSGASLHAKTFAVDGERLFVGSFNFDPRSAMLNTEQGLVINHAGLAQQVSGSLEQYLPYMAYHVQLDGNSKLSWTASDPRPPHAQQVFSKEPGTSWFKRTTVKILGWLPLEGLL